MMEDWSLALHALNSQVFVYVATGKPYALYPYDCCLELDLFLYA